MIEGLRLKVSPRTRYVERGGWGLGVCLRISPYEVLQVMSLNVLIKNILDPRGGKRRQLSRENGRPCCMMQPEWGRARWLGSVRVKFGSIRNTFGGVWTQN